jgi:ABC-type transporter Mla subunit MlaD
MRRGSITANPVLIGAVTLLVVVVATFLSYNANKGLPFVPTTSLKVRVENGANLVPGNEIRSGGNRVGVVEEMKPVRLAGGETGAELTLKLDQRLGDVPSDSTFRIRPRSALGLKYLELTTGRSKKPFRSGDIVPASQAGFSTELDDVLGMFDEPTREASRTNLRGFGDTFAGRGVSVGRTLEELPPLLRSLEPVMRNLADPDTELDRFFAELGDTARVLAPVSPQNAALFTSMADTFEAVGRDRGALKAFIAKSPPTMDAAIASFRVQRPFLADLEGFGEDFGPATAELRGALPPLNDAVRIGAPVQRRAVELNEQTGRTLDSLRELAEAPGTNAALRGIGATVATLNPQLRFYGPHVTVCNHWNYFWTYLAEHFSEEDASGHAQRAMGNVTGRQDNSAGSMGAKSGANGKNVLEGNAQYLQNPAYGAAITPTGEADCEAGQRGWLERNARFHPPGALISRDSRAPGAQGPTFTGRPRVPEGQTYTHKPETGPYTRLPASETELGGGR